MTEGTPPKAGISISDYINTWGKLLLHNKLATPEQWSRCVADFKRQGGKLPIETIVVMLDIVDDARAKAIKSRVKEILIKKHPGQLLAPSKHAGAPSATTPAGKAATAPALAKASASHAPDKAGKPATSVKTGAVDEPDELATVSDSEGSDIDNDPDIIAALGRIADDDEDRDAPASATSPAGAPAQADASASRASVAAATTEGEPDSAISLDADDELSAAPAASAGSGDGDPLDQPLTMDDDDDSDESALDDSGDAADAIVEPVSKQREPAAESHADEAGAAKASDSSVAINWEEGVIELSDGDESDVDPGSIEWTNEVIASEIIDLEDIIVEPTPEMWEALFSEAPLLASGEGRDTVKAALRDSPEAEQGDGELYDLDIDESEDRNDHLSEVDWADGLIGSEDEKK